MWLKIVTLIGLVAVVNLSLSYGRSIEPKGNNGVQAYTSSLANIAGENYQVEFEDSKDFINPVARVKRGLFSSSGSSGGAPRNIPTRPRSNSLPAIPVSKTTSFSSSSSSTSVSKPVFSSSLPSTFTKPAFSEFQPPSSFSSHLPTFGKVPNTPFLSSPSTSFSPSLPSTTFNKPLPTTFSSSFPSTTFAKPINTPFSSSLPSSTKPLSTPLSSPLSSSAFTKPSSAAPFSQSFSSTSLTNPLGTQFSSSLPSTSLTKPFSTSFSSSLPSTTYTKPINAPFSSSLPSATLPKAPGSPVASTIPSNYPFTFTYPVNPVPSTSLSKSPSTSISSSLPATTSLNPQSTSFTSLTPTTSFSKPSSQTLPTTPFSSSNTNVASNYQFQPQRQRVFGMDSSSSSNANSPSNSFRIPSSPQNTGSPTNSLTGLENQFNSMNLNQNANSQPNRRQSWETRPVNCAGLNDNCYFTTAAGLSGQTTFQMVKNTQTMQTKTGSVGDTLDLLKQTNHPNAQSRLFADSNHMNEYIRDTLPAGTSKAYGVGYYVSTSRPLTFNPAIDGPTQGHMVAMSATKNNRNQLNTHAVDFQLPPETRFPPRNDYVNNGFVHLIDPSPPVNMNSWVSSFGNPIKRKTHHESVDLVNPKDKTPKLDDNNNTM